MDVPGKVTWPPAWSVRRLVKGGRTSKTFTQLTEDVFVSSDSAESVTEGIDAVAVPVRSLSGLANAQDTMPASVAGLSE